MVTTLNSRSAARDVGYEMLQYVCGRTQPTVTNTNPSVRIGAVPAGAVIVAIASRVAVAVTGGTPVLCVGSTAGAADICATMAEAAGNEWLMPLTAFGGPLAADTDIWLNCTGGVTAGDAVVAVMFIKPLA